MRLAVIIPTLDAADGLAVRMCELDGEWVIVSDGGSGDGTLAAALAGGAVLASGSKGRGQQLRRGAHRAMLDSRPPDWMLFLHADTALPEGWRGGVEAHAARSNKAAAFAFGAQGKGAKLMGAMVRLRELCWGLPYGDQGLLIPRDLYERVGGFAPMALFEDVDMVERLRAVQGRLVRLPAQVTTDISAHQRDGVWKRGWRNLGLLRAYRRGVPVEELLARYRSRP